MADPHQYGDKVGISAKAGTWPLLSWNQAARQAPTFLELRAPPWASVSGASKPARPDGC
jgi:hypothetical protein